ncbi:MAG TPA: SRPBCC domain-containing protein [Xanthomonadaceae bacterium]|nr:SRPBCC domain-containing protein [Xanthomonadaceae bacterium]
MRDIHWRLHLASPPAKVWELLITDEGRMRFWCDHSRRLGDTIEMRFSNGCVEHAEVLAELPYERLALRYFGTTLSFELLPDGRGGTDLSVRHENVPEHDRDDVLPGWLNVLFPLKAVADHGIDLRNHDPERTWNHGYCDG